MWANLWVRLLHHCRICSLACKQQELQNPQVKIWMKKHPSALSMFEDLMVEAKAKQVVVFLDYDGTLSPIVEDPDRAYVSDDVCQHLHAFPDKASFSEMPCTLLGSDTSLGYLL
ncbi:unnamed protein product [Sphagnum jensenii]|uniref:Trehalose 6-phosphate phosphatase n=1 Tax=Sphagnum jensenii TaxID=128206 RepID=A0ABP1BSU0_9BRYO